MSVFSEVKVATALAVTGRATRKTFVVDSVDFEDNRYIRLHKKETWLCHVVAGKGEHLNPLSRSSLLELGWRLVNASDDNEDPEEEDDFLDTLNEPSSSSPSPPSCKRRSSALDGPSAKRRTGRGAVKKNTLDPGVKEAKVSADLTVRILLNPPGKNKGAARSLWLDQRDLPLFLAFMQKEVVKGGVDYEPQDSALRLPFWVPRDFCWTARTKDADGSTIRKSFFVRRFGSIDGKRVLQDAAQIASQKQEAYQRALEWQANPVGDVTA